MPQSVRGSLESQSWGPRVPPILLGLCSHCLAASRLPTHILWPGFLAVVSLRQIQRKATREKERNQELPAPAG